MSKKKAKIKNNNIKLFTGLAVGATVGLLTFLFVKPKINNKPNEEISKNIQIDEKLSVSSKDLFI
jgi:gas vesicle protein